jgi:hypothetical protein
MVEVMYFNHMVFKPLSFLVNLGINMTNNIHQTIQQELANARQVCDINGVESGECAAAWDAVEELQAEASHQRESVVKNSLEQYCSENPDAAECRVYDD